ncbi:MAG: wax ester/triacylglycerol synthase family O-acyltransferase, partial [Candidatus Methylomirabilis sp.]|nr:wax ester/triacylglycerol synthase family O-acyltransferase [Deltaproteobacteria bacterium]
IHLVPTFRRRIVEVPFDMDRPYWADDPNFDLDFHLRHIAVPPPGTLKELFTLFARIISRPLDRSKPLWEMYYVEGLGEVPGVPEGAVAWLTKIHHSAIDGVSGIDLLTTMLDLSPEIREVEPPAEPWSPPALPTDVELIARATGHRITSPIKFLESLPRVLSSAATYGKEIGRRIIHLEPPKALFRGPKTRLNCAISAQRRFSAATISLADIKTIRKAVAGATVNDAVLAVCAGALRRYLDSKGELPEEGLVAMTPISVRAEGDEASGGNKISSMLCPLHTDVDDPMERLEKIHDAMVEAKEVHGALGANVLMDATNFLPSSTLALAARLYTRVRIADLTRPFFNVVISNVPGPQIPLYAAGARLLAQYPSGPIVEGLALFIGVFSYCGDVTIGLTADRDALPDVDFLAECMTESMAELLEAAEKSQRA